MRSRVIATALLAGSVLFASVLTAPAAQSAVNIGVAPSPNGLVMKDVPTQIAISGTKRARIFLWNTQQKKYFRIGTATPKRALNYTFTNNGIQRIRIRPAKGKAKTFRVAVYEQRPAQAVGSRSSYTPTAYGSTILTSRLALGTYSLSDTRSLGRYATKDYGCRFVSVGGKVDRDSLTLNVQSTGADPRTFTATPGAPFAELDVPIGGDVVIEASFSGGQNRNSLESTPAEVGLVLTCLNPNWSL